MKILGYDLETTSLNTDTGRIVEIAAILYDSEHRNFIEFYSTLCWSDGHHQEPWTTEKWHGIPRDLARDSGSTMMEAITRVQSMMLKADAICGHNQLNFDRPYLESECRRLGLYSVFEMLKKEKVWIDTNTDLPFDESVTSKRLNHLLADHGLHNHQAHRALFDVYYTLKLLQCYPLEQVLERSKSKTIKIAVFIPMEQNAVVKSRRYMWNKDHRNKAELKYWYKIIKECDLKAETEAIGVEPMILETL